MTSSYSPSEQQYIDADGDGQTDVLVLGGSPPPEKLDEKQIKYFTTLIQDNPTNSPWPDKIKEIKTLYSGQLPDTAVPWTTLQKDNFSSDLSKSYLSRSELYKKSNNPDVKAASATTGKTILTASKELKSFAVKTENALTNFINLATKADDFLLDLPGEIKGVTSIITNAAKGYVGKIGNALSEALIGGIKSGLDGVASKIFGAFKRFKRALPRVINAQSALIKPISAVFKGLNCLGQKVADSLQGAIEDMLTGMVKNVLNAPACAINQFIGAVTAKINSAIDSFVTPLTGGISKILGPVFKVKNILSKGINLANKIGDFLSCKPKNSTDSKGTNVETIDGTGKIFCSIPKSLARFATILGPILSINLAVTVFTEFARAFFKVLVFPYLSPEFFGHHFSIFPNLFFSTQN